MSRNTRCAILILVFVLGCAGWLFGASQNATIYGNVYNAAGNPMPDVTVTLENRALGFTRTAVTSSDGSYNFAEVPPADNYTVTAKLGGRQLDQRTGITVNVGDERVILPPLTETVQVAAPGPGVPTPPKGPAPKAVPQPTVRNETVSATVSGVVTGDQMRSLPLYNRNFLILGLITPNVHDTEASSALAGASFSVAGARPSQNNFLMDGTENLASSSNQAIPFQVNDSVQEFRVISSVAAAEYGRNLGGTVNIVTKRATNSFHGSVYGYFGNEALNADSPLSVYNGTTFDKSAAYAGYTSAGTPITTPIAAPTDAEFYSPFTYNQYVANALARGYCTNSIAPGYLFANAPNTCAGAAAGLNTVFDPRAILSQHNSFSIPFDSKQFGASAGGALVKDKWFVFGSYEGTLIDNPNPILERVPSSFDKTYDPNGTGRFGFGPADPNFVLAQNILGLFPASNINALGSGAVPGVLEFYQGQAPNYTHVHNFLFRTDFVKSEKSDFSLRYVAQFLKQLHDDSLPAGGAYPGNGAFRDAVNQNASLSYTHSFSPKIINELHLVFTRFDVGESPQDAGFDATTLGLPFKQMPTILLNGIDTQSSGQRRAGTVNDLGAFSSWMDAGGGFTTMVPWADGRFPFARLGAPLGAPGERRDSTYAVTDNLSWSRGKHSFKLGAEFRHLDNDLFNGAFARGIVYSGNIGEFTSDSEACNLDVTLTNFCTANAFRLPSFDFAQFNPTYSGKFSSYVIAGFFQDSYRARKGLTINYGLRYEYFSVPYEVNNNIWNFDARANGLVQQGGTAITDPFGNVCGATNPSWGVLTPFVSHLLGLGIPGLSNMVQNWATTSQPTGLAPGQTFPSPGCKATTSGFYNQMAKPTKLNFAPRIGFAWNVRGDEVKRPTVFRFGAGVYYDQTPISTFSQLLYNRPMTSPNTFLGQSFSGSDLFFGNLACGFGGLPAQCGLGNTVITPAGQAALSRDGVNPNSYYSSVTQPFSIYAIDSNNSHTPWAWQANMTIQQQLSPKLTTEVGYVGTFAKFLPVVYDQNYANEWGHVRTLAAGPALSSLQIDNMSQFPIFTMTNRGTSNYNSLLARVRMAGWHGLRLNATYSYSRGMDNSSTGIFPTLPISPRGLLISDQYLVNSASPPSLLLVGSAMGTPSAGTSFGQLVFPNIDFGAGALTTTGARPVLVSPYNIPQNPFDFLVNDWGRSDFDSTHRVTVDYVWETKSSSRLWDMWSFSGIFTGQTGQPMSIFAGPIAGAVNQRADLGVPANEIVISSDPNHAIDPSQYIFLLQQGAGVPGAGSCPRIMFANNASTFMPIPGVPCAGHSGRNQFVGPSYINMNFAIQKGFNVFGESKKLYLRAEFFNLFDRANYYNPISSISDNGVAASENFGTIKSAHDPRQIQLAVRFSW